MDNKKENQSLLSDLKKTKDSTIYGVVIYDRGDNWEETTEIREKVDTLLALLAKEEELTSS